MEKKPTPNPYHSANAWSRQFHRYSKYTFDVHITMPSRFSWISPLLDLSHEKEVLDLPDLYDILPQHRAVLLTDQLESCWSDELKRHPNRPSLLRPTIRSMGWTPWIIGAAFIPKVNDL